MMLNNRQKKELADFMIFTQIQLKNIEQYVDRNMDKSIIQEMIVIKDNTAYTIIDIFKDY